MTELAEEKSENVKSPHNERGCIYREPVETLFGAFGPSLSQTNNEKGFQSELLCRLPNANATREDFEVQS